MISLVITLILIACVITLALLVLVHQDKFMTKEQIEKEIHYHQRIIENHQREIEIWKRRLNRIS